MANSNRPQLDPDRDPGQDPHHAQPPADPAESWRLIAQARADAERQLVPDPRLLYWPWGVAWLVGFTVLFLRYGPGGRVYVDLPAWLPLTVLFSLLFVAGLVSGISGARASGQVIGESAVRGRRYGVAWFLAYAGMGTILSRVTSDMTDADAGLLWAASAVAITGTLHIAGGAIWSDRDLFVLGVYLSVVNMVGVVAGAGWHSLVVAVAGGGGMLVVGALASRRRSAPQRPAVGAR